MADIHEKNDGYRAYASRKVVDRLRGLVQCRTASASHATHTYCRDASWIKRVNDVPD